MKHVSVETDTNSTIEEKKGVFYVVRAEML
jgi:hypothetical protein